MAKTFYQFLMTYRGKIKPDLNSKLADLAFHDPAFPKQAKEYDQISEYIEMKSYFLDATNVFDQLWEKYENER